MKCGHTKYYAFRYPECEMDFICHLVYQCPVCNFTWRCSVCNGYKDISTLVVSEINFIIEEYENRQDDSLC